MEGCVSNRGLMIAVWLAIAFAGVVLGVLIKTRMMHHRSADQQILIQKSHQN
jgi:heme exporter protein D